MKLRIVIEGKTYEVEYDAGDEEVSASAKAAGHEQSIVLPTSQAQSEVHSEGDESKVYRSPVAGIVTIVHVVPAQIVQPGEILLVVEAMKMENTLASAVSAKVSSVEIRVGDTVKVGQILIRFE